MGRSKSRLADKCLDNCRINPELLLTSEDEKPMEEKLDFKVRF